MKLSLGFFVFFFNLKKVLWEPKGDKNKDFWLGVGGGERESFEMDLEEQAQI